MQAAEPLLEHVLERDVDLAVAATLYASAGFRSHVLNKLGFSAPHRLVSVRVSDSNEIGETDVLLVVDVDDVGKIAVMIEDKIAARFQNQQARRYDERGTRGQAQYGWTSFHTCLCAPRGYLATETSKGEWGSYLALEDFCDWAAESQDPHGLFLRAICSQAVAKWSRRADVSVEATAFWQHYRQAVADLLPNVTIRQVGDAVTAFTPWPRFVRADMHPDMVLEHKPANGRVDLTFKNVSVEELRCRLTSPVHFDMRLVKAGKFAALRLAVPRIDHLRPFEAQQDEVLCALAAVDRLLTVAEAGSARPPVTSEK